MPFQVTLFIVLRMEYELLEELNLRMLHWVSNPKPQHCAFKTRSRGEQLQQVGWREAKALPPSLSCKEKKINWLRDNVTGQRFRGSLEEV